MREDVELNTLFEQPCRTSFGAKISDNERAHAIFGPGA